MILHDILENRALVDLVAQHQKEKIHHPLSRGEKDVARQNVKANMMRYDQATRKLGLSSAMAHAVVDTLFFHVLAYGIPFRVDTVEDATKARLIVSDQSVGVIVKYAGKNILVAAKHPGGSFRVMHDISGVDPKYLRSGFRRGNSVGLAGAHDIIKNYKPEMNQRDALVMIGDVLEVAKANGAPVVIQLIISAHEQARALNLNPASQPMRLAANESMSLMEGPFQRIGDFFRDMHARRKELKRIDRENTEKMLKAREEYKKLDRRDVKDLKAIIAAHNRTKRGPKADVTELVRAYDGNVKKMMKEIVGTYDSQGIEAAIGNMASKMRQLALDDKQREIKFRVAMKHQSQDRDINRRQVKIDALQAQNDSVVKNIPDDPDEMNEPPARTGWTDPSEPPAASVEQPAAPAPQAAQPAPEAPPVPSPEPAAPPAAQTPPSTPEQPKIAGPIDAHGTPITVGRSGKYTSANGTTVVRVSRADPSAIQLMQADGRRFAVSPATAAKNLALDPIAPPTEPSQAPKPATINATGTMQPTISATAQPAVGPTPPMTLQAEVMSALKNLGFKNKEVDGVVKQVIAQNPNESLEKLIGLSLGKLALPNLTR